METIQKVLSLIGQLDDSTKMRLVQLLHQQVQTSVQNREPLIQDIRKVKSRKGWICPYCGTGGATRFGTYRIHGVQRQRYRCQHCRKTFSDLTYTPLAGTWYPDKWIRFIQDVLESRSLRQSAQALKISLPTAFQWRHKVLAALDRLEIPNFQGIVELDETYFLYSEKGSRSLSRPPRKRGGHSSKRGISRDQVNVLAVCDRQGCLYLRSMGRGRLRTRQLDAAIGNRLSEATTLCTDAWRAFTTYARKKQLPHYRFKSTEKMRSIKGVYHIQNANNCHSRLKRWVIRFNGVATKYLNHYLAWFRFLNTVGFENTEHNLKKLLVTACTA